MRPTPRRFTVTDDAFIRANYRSMPCGDIARHLSWSIAAIRKRASKIGASKPLKRWNHAEDEFIRNNQGKMQLLEAAKHLDRSLSEVSARCKKLGIGRWRVGKGTHGGRPIDGFRDGSPIYTHRRVVEKRLRRKLRSDEIVHHIDADKNNNKPTNLYVFKSRSAHRKAHMSLEAILPALMASGAVFFNRNTGLYELCATNR